MPCNSTISNNGRNSSSCEIQLSPSGWLWHIFLKELVLDPNFEIMDSFHYHPHSVVTDGFVVIYLDMIVLAISTTTSTTS